MYLYFKYYSIYRDQLRAHALAVLHKNHSDRLWELIFSGPFLKNSLAVLKFVVRSVFLRFSNIKWHCDGLESRILRFLKRIHVTWVGFVVNCWCAFVICYIYMLLVRLRCQIYTSPKLVELLQPNWHWIKLLMFIIAGLFTWENY